MFRFSVRSLLCCSALVAAGLGVGAAGLRTRLLEGAAVERMLRLGARVSHESGARFAPSVVAVTFDPARDARVAPSDLDELACFATAQSFSLKCLPLSDEHVSKWARLRHLEVLDLGNTAITDASMPVLGELPRLQALVLQGDRVGDRGVAALAATRSLQYLNLRETRVTNAGLAMLARMLALDEVCLSISSDGVTREGIESLRRARPKLRVTVSPWPMAPRMRCGTEVKDDPRRRLQKSQ